jgi:FtsH-binding integral membrane protein
MTEAGQRAPRHTVATGVAALTGSLLAQNIGAALAKLIFPLVGAFGVTAIRIALSAMILAAVLRPWRRRVSRAMLPALLGYGAMLGLMNLLIYQAFARIPIGIATGIEILGPLAVALAGSRRAIDRLWLAAAAAGLWLLVPLHSGSGLDPLGLLFAAAAAACWAFYILFGNARVAHAWGRCGRVGDGCRDDADDALWAGDGGCVAVRSDDPARRAGGRRPVERLALFTRDEGDGPAARACRCAVVQPLSGGGGACRFRDSGRAADRDTMGRDRLHRSRIGGLCRDRRAVDEARRAIGPIPIAMFFCVK